MVIFETLHYIVWKLASRTLVFMDWEGFSEMVLPGSRPGGLLRYLARLISLTGLSEDLWWLPYLVLPLALGVGAHLLVLGSRRWRWLPVWILCALVVSLQPLLSLGIHVWLEIEPAFVLFNLLGLLAVCVLVGTWRRVARRGGIWRLLAVLGTLVFFVPCGLYAVLAAFVLLFPGGRSVWRTRREALWGLAGAMLALVSVPCVCRGVYDDLSLWEALPSTHGFRFYGENSQKFLPQLRLERRIRADDFSGALCERASMFPLRMEIALRILAQFRTGCVLDGLFATPIRTTHVTAKADELRMDGHLLLFHYGFMLPARRALFERLTSIGWDPESFRYLGDIAFIRGERALARRDYRQLARCPGWRAFARRRLAALDDPQQHGAEDLMPIATLAQYWDAWHRSQSDPFFDQTENVEAYVYNRFRRLRAGSPDMVRMALAAAILCGDAKKVAENTSLLEALAPPPDPWPRAAQEALVAYLPPAALSRFRAGAFEPATLRRWDAWRVDSTRMSQTALLRLYGDTYWLYRFWTDRQKVASGEMR